MERIRRILEPHSAERRTHRPMAGIAASVLTVLAALTPSRIAIAQDTDAAAAGGAERWRQQIEIVERANALRSRELSEARRAAGDTSALTRAAAARVLGEAAEEADGPRLVALLGDGSAFVRQEAVVALGIMSFAPARPHLVQALGDRASGVREQAAYALAIIGAGQAEDTEAIARLAGDPEPSVREGVARALGLLSGPRAADALAVLLRDSVESVRNAAQHSLNRRGGGAAGNPNFNLDPDRDGNPDYDYNPPGDSSR
jgi:HEAT repeat protein